MRPILRSAIAALLLVGVSGLEAQISLTPTPAPLVTAENESWYLAGEPITFSGSFYYPGGPQVHFNPREMVRTGDYRGIPLYSRTTIEPFSKVFVPLPGGLMQPYERRRAGELAGTAGSTAPSLPIVLPAEQEGAVYLRQAQAPPMLAAPLLGLEGSSAPDIQAGAASIGTAGSADVDEVEWGSLRSARKPAGLNAIFVEYGGQRWFSSGPPQELDARTFTRIGAHHGFAVYARDGQHSGTIYIQVTKDALLVSPYSRR